MKATQCLHWDQEKSFFIIFLVYVSWSNVLKWQSLFLMNFTFLIIYLFIYCIFLGNSEGKKSKGFYKFQKLLLANKYKLLYSLPYLPQRQTKQIQMDMKMSSLVNLTRLKRYSDSN